MRPMALYVAFGVRYGLSDEGEELNTLTMPTPQSDTYTEAETIARREAALRRAFATPHKPHTASKGKRRESSQSK